MVVLEANCACSTQRAQTICVFENLLSRLNEPELQPVYKVNVVVDCLQRSPKVACFRCVSSWRITTNCVCCGFSTYGTALPFRMRAFPSTDGATWCFFIPLLNGSPFPWNRVHGENKRCHGDSLH